MSDETSQPWYAKTPGPCEHSLSVCPCYGDATDSDRYCATCNEPEFSEYAANCHAHTSDNMIEA